MTSRVFEQNAFRTEVSAALSHKKTESGHAVAKSLLRWVLRGRSDLLRSGAVLDPATTAVPPQRSITLIERRTSALLKNQGARFSGRLVVSLAVASNFMASSYNRPGETVCLAYRSHRAASTCIQADRSLLPASATSSRGRPAMTTTRMQAAMVNVTRSRRPPSDSAPEYRRLGPPWLVWLRMPPARARC